jgi:hypothetical protein
MPRSNVATVGGDTGGDGRGDGAATGAPDGGFGLEEHAAEKSAAIADAAVNVK